jgi:tetratricopeptide (TPR) repeat protein
MSLHLPRPAAAALLALLVGCTPTVEGPAELRVVAEDLPLRLTQEVAKRATENSPARFAEVERDVRHMLSRRLHRTAENLRKRAQYLELLGRIHAEQGDFADAEAAYRESVEAWRSIADAADAEAFANALVQLAGIHYRLNDYARASAGYAEAISREEIRLGADHDDLLGLLSIRAGLELKLGHAAEAERLLRRQLETIVRIRGVDRREAASVMDHLAEALSLQDRRTEAAELRQKAKEIRRKLCDEC